MGLNLAVVPADFDYAHHDEEDWERVDRLGELNLSYGSFNDVRRLVAAHHGITLSRMQGYGGTAAWSGEALRPLLDHSDSDGTLAWWACDQCLPALIAACRPLPAGTLSQLRLRELIGLFKVCVNERAQVVFT